MRRAMAAGGAALALAIVVVPVWLAAARKPPRPVLLLPQPIPELLPLGEHPAVRWLCARFGMGLVRQGPDGEWTMTALAESMQLQHSISFRLRPGAKLPNGLPATAESITEFLRHMGDRLAADPRTRQLDVTARMHEQRIWFVTASAHEGLRAALLQLVPNVFEDAAEERAAVVLQPRDASRAGDIAARINETARSIRKLGPRAAVSHLFPDGPLVDVHNGMWVARAEAGVGRTLRALSQPLLPVVDKGGVEVRGLFERLVPSEVAAEGGLAWFSTEPGGEAIATGRTLAVAAIFNVRRLSRTGPRKRLATDAADLRDLGVDVLCRADDADARAEAEALLARWTRARARARLLALPGDEFAARYGRGDFDILVVSMGEELFADPHPYWHSKGTRNASGHTAVDALVARVDEAVSAKGSAAAIRHLRRRLEDDGVLRVLREKELFLCGSGPIMTRIRRGLGLD